MGLCRKERLEQLRLNLGRDTPAGVLYSYNKESLDGICFDLDNTFAFDSLYSVAYEVLDHLPQ